MVTVGGGGGASQSNCRLIFFLPSVLIQLDLFTYFLEEVTEHKTVSMVLLSSYWQEVCF